MKIGIIGLGDMGQMFAKIWAQKTDYQVFGSDLPQHTERLKIELAPLGIEVLSDGSQVSRICDFIMYCVEAENIEAVVAAYAPSTKVGAIVAGQTSVKHIEIRAFEQHLPADAQIVTAHSLHGPNLDPSGQTLVLMNHRATAEAYQTAKKIFEDTGSDIFELENTELHDKMMADVQVITHIGFESIGTTWMRRGLYPWETEGTQNVLDHIKVLMTLRIYSYKFHVYSGLAIQNPFGRNDARVYADAQSELFELMVTENETAFRAAIYAARDFVFKDHSKDLILNEEFLKTLPKSNKANKANSHLSLMAMVATWHKLGVNPYQYKIVQTPPFRMRVGMAEYLFLNDDLLEESIQAALYDKSLRGEDLAFHTSVHEWVNIVAYGDKKGYAEHFAKTKAFLADRLDYGRDESSKILAALAKK